MAHQRLFVGNLPSDTTENDLNKLFKKFGVSNIEVKRKTGLDQESVFAYVNISKEFLDDCLNKYRNKNWRNSVLKVEVAKENFLDRLKKERNKQKELNSAEFKTVVFNSNTFNRGCVQNKKIKFNLDDEKSNDNENLVSQNWLENDTINLRNAKSKKTSTVSDDSKISDLSEDDTPRKGKLPMFKGTLAFCSNLKEPPVSEFSMKRFEDFSSVWRDESPERSAYNSHGKRKSDQFIVELNEKRTVIEKETENKSKNLADSKRVNALQEKWNNIKKKKETIRNALQNMDLGVKRKFPETETIEQEHSISREETKKKLILFEDDPSDDDIETNFEVKEHLEGKNGYKLLKLKSKLANDDRFKLDDRFFENNEDNKSNCDRLAEAGSVQQNGKFKDILQNRSLIRYDPTKPDHKVLEKKMQQNIVEEKKKKMKKMTEKHKQTEKKITLKTETPKPEVSKEKYYSVADTLKNVFRKTEDKSEFRLSSLFDEKLKNDKKSTTEYISDDVSPIKKIKLIVNPFENISESDDEEVIEDEAPVELPVTAASEKIMGRCGIWGETFFFKTSDSRLLEAINFYKDPTKTRSTDYNKQRTKLKCIVRKKIQNSRRETKLFKQKLGGKMRVNKTKFNKRLKRARL